MRGEKDFFFAVFLSSMGSPPHARGKEFRLAPHVCFTGITPACAGKRKATARFLIRSRDHPRMRGEKLVICQYVIQIKGSPPHARGKAGDAGRHRDGGGITPACAGKRARNRRFRPAQRDHPRMRGEKFLHKTANSFPPGSPPHARGKAESTTQALRPVGITPACAGKRPYNICIKQLFKDHPRMRGEKVKKMRGEWKHRGSPPHARGKENQIVYQQTLCRITPACAGKSHAYQNYDNIKVGSPPHARGKD